MLMTFATAMLEDEHAKGTGWSVSSHLSGYSGQPGRDAAQSAIATMGGQRVKSGAYRVVLGPQALTEILEWVLMPSLQVDALYDGVSTFMGKLNQKVATEELYLYDDGSMPGLAASRAITDEGVPTGRTDLIKDGVLVGLLSNFYEQQRMLKDPRGKEKLGVEPASVSNAIAARNGFRTGRGGGRNFDELPAITPTNLVIEGQMHRSPKDLLAVVEDGTYIGRIWYTYPVNGIAAGDFSGTIVGDSYIVRDGRIAAAVRPNTLRMSENIHNVLNSILAIGSERRGTVRWSSDQVTWAPEVGVEDFHLDEIAGYMDDVF